MSVRRRSGVVVEVSGLASLDAERDLGPEPEAGFLPPPRSGRRRRRGPSRAGVVATGMEASAIEDAMAAAQMERVDAIPLRTGAALGEPVTRHRFRRGAKAHPPTRATASSTVGLGVPVARNERAVVLLEQDGVYSWHLPEQIVPAPRAAGRTAHFRVPIPAGRVSAPPPPGRPRRRGLKSLLIGKAVAYVFRFVAKPVLKGATKFLERHVIEGPVHVSGADPSSWVRIGSTDVLPVASKASPRVLLLVHGTFSSTVGSFGALAATEEGKAFLDAALRRYDLVIGWDHKTLSVTPRDNAKDLLRWLRVQKWKKKALLDAVAFSRGGLVLRSLVEELLPRSPLKAELRRAVFVGCTNGGTELARPANWRRLADLHMNLVAAGARALAAVPGLGVAGILVSEGIQGLGALLKVLATSAVDDDAVPGLSAMDPDGAFVKRINQKQPGQPSVGDVYYCAVTSNFDPDEATGAGHTSEMPPGLLLKLADKGADVLYGKPNDLVVHVEAMTQIDPDVGAYVRERLDYGTNGIVHHCRYFAESETAATLSRWLELPSS